jgi:hypothetical protein
MGTRNLVAVVMNKKVRVAQYGQWDGYLEGQGKTVMEFIKKNRSAAKLNKFRKAVDECKFLSETEAQKTWTDCGAVGGEDSVTMAVADKHSALYPGLSRDTGAKILDLIRGGTVRGLVDSIDFALDSLFCEWAYVLDLDKEVLEIYRGFTKSGKVKGRFAKMEVQDAYNKKKGYGPISLYKKIKFADCGAAKLKSLVKEFNAEMEESA